MIDFDEITDIEINGVKYKAGCDYIYNKDCEKGVIITTLGIIKPSDIDDGKPYFVIEEDNS